MRSLLLLCSLVSLGGCASGREDAVAAGTESAVRTEASAVSPSSAVSGEEQITVTLSPSSDPGETQRVYVPVTVNGQAEHVLLDSGTARTWLRLPNTAKEFTPDAFVAKIGDTTVSVFGRNVPPFNETVDGRTVIGTIGIDWLSGGPTVLDLGKGTLTRFPTGTNVPGSETWPTLPVTETGGLIHGHVAVDGIDHLVIPDTGSPTTLLIAAAQPGDTPRTAHDALGNPFTLYDGVGELVIAPGAAHSPVRVSRAPVFPHLTQIAQALGLPIDGLLGLSSMGSKRVLFDLGNGVLRFER